MDELELKTHLEENHSKSFVWAMSCCSQDPLEAEDILQTVYLKILEGRANTKESQLLKLGFLPSFEIQPLIYNEGNAFASLD